MEFVTVTCPDGFTFRYNPFRCGCGPFIMQLEVNGEDRYMKGDKIRELLDSHGFNSETVPEAFRELYT